MIRILEILIKFALATIAYLCLRNKKPEHAIALAVAILSA